MMRKVTKEVKIGIAFVVALFLVYFGINFLKGVNVFKPANSYVVIFNDVSGMLQADPITINGLKIGQVHEMTLDPHNPKNVLVHVQMNKDIKIPLNSTIKLDAAMLGGTTLILEPSLDAKGFHVPGDTIYGTRKSGMMEIAAGVVPKIENLLPKLDSILTGVDKLVNQSNLQGTLQNVNEITADFTQSTKEINKLLAGINKDMPAMTKSLGNTIHNFEKMSNQVNDINLVATFNKLDSTMTNVQHLSSQLNSKDSSLGLLLNDRQLYDSLNATVGNASMLLKDVKENPSRYINIKVF